MALKLGWAPRDVRTSYYWRDPSVNWDATPEDAREAYRRDGDAAHLTLHNGATPPPSKILIRALTADERAWIEDQVFALPSRRAGETDEAYTARIEREGDAFPMRRIYLWAFRVGCEMPDNLPDAAKERGPGGVWAMPRPWVDALIHSFGDDVYLLYGRLVWEASNLTADEGKA